MSDKDRGIDAATASFGPAGTHRHEVRGAHVALFEPDVETTEDPDHPERPFFT